MRNTARVTGLGSVGFVRALVPLLIGLVWALAAAPGQAASLQEVTGFGSNPGGLRMFKYVPDNLPSHRDISVHEYLDFFARAYGLKGERRRRTVREVMEFTGLEPLAEKLTSALSKGMKQRLCLGKTLLHDPSVLILDEPAAGLDPRARVELRELVKALAEMKKAILVSSHILSELSEICDGVAIIEAGRIQASGRVEDIVRDLRSHTEIYLRCLAEPEAVERTLAELPGVDEVRPARQGVVFHFAGDEDALAALLEALVRAGLRPVEFASEETDLEDVFLSLTEGKVQ